MNWRHECCGNIYGALYIYAISSSEAQATRKLRIVNHRRTLIDILAIAVAAFGSSNLAVAAEF